MSEPLQSPGPRSGGGQTVERDQLPTLPHRGRATVPAVSVRGLSKSFDRGRVTALDLESLTVDLGEFVSITGPSGCGKSTLLHLLAALDRPSSGSVQVFGQDLRRLPSPTRYRRTEVGIVFQLQNLIPQLTARENVEIAMFGTGLRRGERRERATQLLADVGLVEQADRPPTRLSGGERQRVAIARALANSPRLLLADEPTGSLDADSIERFLALLERLRRQQPELTVVMVTHDEQVAAVADRVISMQSVADSPTPG
ncbi:MAG TPA: ABC transporter ATP-binding protein [Frankiaceae bacterium]|nr:ABC transporter ATP-binding protein [Frankiaceae bacterium]